MVNDITGQQISILSDAMRTFYNIQAKRMKLGGYDRIQRQDARDHQAGYLYGLDRDVYGALGYPDYLNYQIYHSWYKRDPLARRIINAPVSAVWADPPEISEEGDIDTPFEQAFKDLVKRTKLWQYIKRADRMSGIGQYSVLFLGFDGDDDLSQEPIGERQLIYIRPYPEGSVSIQSLVKDASNERFGLPEIYDIQIQDVGSKIVHWSRIIHIVSDAYDSDIYGVPRLESVINYIMAALLVVGSSGEAFWRIAVPAWGLMQEGDSIAVDLDTIKDEMDKFIHQLQRYVHLQGIDLKQYEPTVASPKDTMDVILDMISAGTGIPKRILSGSEIGMASSKEDRMNWGDRVNEYRGDREESIIRPLLSRLIKYGALPPPASGEEGYSIDWVPIYTPTEEERATVANMRAKTVGEYVTKGLEIIWPRKIFFTQEMDYTDEEFEAMEDLIDQEYKEEEEFNRGFDENDLTDENQQEDEENVK